MEFTDFSLSFLCITQAQEGSERWEQKEYWFGAVGPRDGTVARSPVLFDILRASLNQRWQPRATNRY